MIPATGDAMGSPASELRRALRHLCLFGMVAEMNACASVSRTPAADQEIPFVVLSPVVDGGGGFVIRGRFEGTAVIRGDWVDVTVPRGLIFLSKEATKELGQLRLRGALASGNLPRGWRRRSESLGLQVSRVRHTIVHSAGDDSSTVVLDSLLTFELARPRGVPWSDLWLYFEFEQPTTTGGRATLGWSYAFPENPRMFVNVRSQR